MCHVLRRHLAAQRRSLLNRPVETLPGRQTGLAFVQVDVPVGDPLPHGGPGQSRTDGVHIDVVRRQPESIGLGKVDHARLGRAVRWGLRIALAPGNRRDVDDLAVLARLHEIRHGV